MTCILSFRDTSYYVSMCIGKKCEVTQLGNIPSNFLVKSFFYSSRFQSRLIDVVITHAGFNSVNEAFLFLAIPHVNDRNMMAKRLVSMYLEVTECIKELSSEIMRFKTETFIIERKIKGNCTQFFQKIKSFDKLKQTV
jgi:hypothetical protein